MPVDDPCELDPSNIEHVTAIHEAGHAFGLDRVGATISRCYLIRIRDLRTDGETAQLDRPETPQAQIDRSDRAAALAGVQAEELFSGSADSEECEHDLEIAETISAELGEAVDEVIALVRDALGENGAWEVIQRIACALLDAVPGVSLRPEAVHLFISETLGPPSAAWRRLSGQ